MNVFVSHSTPRDESEFLDDFCAALERHNLHVLVDRREIEAGDEWRQIVHGMIADCDHAVVLLTPRALESEWVLKEATWLCWRQYCEELKLILVLSGVGRDSLEAGPFGPLGLTELQYVSEDDPSSAADEVALRLEGVRPPASNIRALVETIEEKLRDVSPKRLARAWEQAQQDLDARLLTDVRSLPELVVGVALSEGPRGLNAVLNVLAPIQQSLRHSGALRDIVTLLAPLWIDPEAAGLLGLTIKDRDSGPFQDIALNGRYLSQHTARWYVERAFPEDWTLPPISVDGALGYDALEKIKDDIRAGAFPGREVSAGEADRMLNRAEARAKRFVLLPPGVDETLLDDLRQVYPRLTFILSFPEPPDDHDVPTRVRFLRPPLSEEDEQLAVDSFSEASDLAEQWMHG